MYKVDPILLGRFKNHIQTSANNNDPRFLAYIARNKTALSSQRFWEKQLITPTVGTRSSIALRRPKGHFSADMIFTAQVENGTAVIRYAEPWSNIDDMDWNVLTTIPNVIELSIMFDGFMLREDDKVESYTTGNYPYAIYVNADGSLKVLNLNDPLASPITVSDLAVNVASIRGLYSERAGVDDGILIFYTNSLGELWESQLLNGEIQYLSKIDLLPSGVTQWLDCWASLTFDYRVALQLKGDDGNVYTLVSKSRPSGFALTDVINYFGKIAEPPFCQIGYAPPLLVNAYNTASNPLEVKLIFDSAVYIFDYSVERVWLTGSNGRTVHPKAVARTQENEITLTFDVDLVGLPRPQTINDYKYRPCGFGSSDGVSAIIDGWSPQLLGVDFSNAGEDVLNYFASVYGTSGELVKAFDGKSYLTETINYFASPHAPSGPVNGTLIDVTFVKGYHLSSGNVINYFSSVYSSVSGTLLKADGTPI